MLNIFEKNFFLFLFLPKKCQKVLTYTAILLDSTWEHRDAKHSSLKQARYRPKVGTSTFSASSIQSNIDEDHRESYAAAGV